MQDEDAIRENLRQQLYAHLQQQHTASIDRMIAEHGMPASFAQTFLNQRMEELMPYVEEVWRESESAGPLTEDQLTTASIRQSQAKIQHLLATMAERVPQMQSGPRKETAEAMLAHFLRFQPRFEALSGEATQANLDDLQSFAEDSANDMRRVTEELRQQRTEKPNSDENTNE